MATTMRTDVLIPEVYAGMIMKNIEENAVMLGMCDVDKTLKGQAGDSITIPKWNLGTKAIKLKEGDAIPYDKLTHTTQKIDLFQLAKGYEITDRALLASYGDPVGEMARQIGLLIAEEMDNEVIEIAKKTPLTFNCANPTAITANELDEALNLYGDNQNVEEFEGIVINPKLKSAFYSMPDFIKADNTSVKKENGIIKKNIIGEFRGIKVILSSKGTFDSSTKQCLTYIIKKNSLLVTYKRELNPEQARDIDRKLTKVNADLITGVGLVNDAGIVVIKNK
ncbi:hypothetical protein BS638_06035 [Clostridium tepidum]|uniref:N4-gp56 family major capsid protein n=1 Tax=Clostridium tepidum TaxID=1962263 RepID=A0A1S9I9V8_9CLOT|nr:phage major capsid protein [Clostridium tepidum]OOO67089.1 hypothetical protein BS638_06035 [Clostridium tepidum]